jgi:hypothetical protein
MLRDMLALPGIQLSAKGLLLGALDLHATYNRSLADAHTAAFTRSPELTQV